VVEEWKWRGVPVWEHDGIICTGETYEAAVKMTFAKGAALKDPSRLFNSSLEGNTRRALRPRSGGRRGSSKRVGRPSVIFDAGGYRSRRSPRRLVGLAAVALSTGNAALPRVL
jgi:hypothetical protein